MKSGGARVITFDMIADFNNTDIYLITIYDKSEQDTKSQNSYGDNTQEQLFNFALTLVITWINRILFLKLLEGQLQK